MGEQVLVVVSWREDRRQISLANNAGHSRDCPPKLLLCSGPADEKRSLALANQRLKNGQRDNRITEA